MYILQGIPEHVLRSIAASVFLSILMGMISPLISMKGIAFLTHATFHSLLLGAVIGMIAGLFTGSFTLLTLFAAALTVLTVMAIAYIENKGITSDTATGIISSIVAGLTVLSFGFLYIVMENKPYVGASQNVVSYLIGEIFLLSLNDLLELSIGSFILVILLMFLYRDFVYLSFDPETLTSYGAKIHVYLYILYVIVGASAAVIVKTTGLITLQVIAVLPGAISLKVSNNLKKIVLISILVACLSQLASIYLATLSSFPPSGIAAILLALIYSATMLIRKH